MIIMRLCIALPQNINRGVSVVVVIIIGYPISTRAAHAVTFRSVAAAQSKFSFIFIFFLPQKNTVKLFGLLVYHTVAVVVVVSIGGEGGGVFFCITLIRWNSPKPPSDFLQCLPLAVSYQFHCCILIPIQSKVGIRKNNNSISFPAGGGGEGEYFCNSLFMSFVLLCQHYVHFVYYYYSHLFFFFVFIFHYCCCFALNYYTYVCLFLSFAPVCVVLLLPLLPLLLLLLFLFEGTDICSTFWLIPFFHKRKGNCSFVLLSSSSSSPSSLPQFASRMYWQGTFFYCIFCCCR